MTAYLLPFIVYVAIPPLALIFWKDPYWAYAARVLLTLPLLVFFLKEYREIRIEKDWLGIIFGILIFVFWLWLDPFYPKIFGGKPIFNPTPLFKTTLALKFIGMVILAPWLEELFFRSFLPRFLQKGVNWYTIPPGSFTSMTFIGSALIFGLIHHEWIPALLMGLLMNWLFQKTRNLWSCILSH